MKLVSGTVWDFINQSRADFLINMCLILMVSVHERTKQRLKIYQVTINDMKVAVQYAIIRRLAGLVHSEDTINYESC